jgi:hypothetical protein
MSYQLQLTVVGPNFLAAEAGTVPFHCGFVDALPTPVE